MNLRWRNVLLVAAAIVAMAYNRWITAFLRSLRLGVVREDFAWEIERMPPLGRYALVCLLLLLFYLTGYMLILNWIRRG